MNTYDEYEGFGPVLRWRANRFGVFAPRQLAMWTIKILVLVGVGIVIAVLALVFQASSNIERVEVAGLQPADRSLNVLLVGSDSRDGLTAHDLVSLGTEAVEGRRTDTIFVLSVDGGRAAILSFPRDLWLKKCDGTEGRINAAYSQGGPSCLVQTITENTGIPITHYAEINLFGFVKVVDAAGGVPVWLDEPMVDAWANVNLPAGCSILDGKQAIGFVRARHVDSDLGRIARQQRVLKTLSSQVISPEVLANLPRLFRIAEAGGSSMVADPGLGTLQLFKLAFGARGIAGTGIASYTVPTISMRRGDAAVLEPTSEAITLYQSFINHSILNRPSSDVAATVDATDVSLKIRNGTGINGLAAQAKDVLESYGYEVSSVGNANPAQFTTVIYPNGKAAQAQSIAALFENATTRLDSTAKTIQLVLGSSMVMPPKKDEAQTPVEQPLLATPAPGTQQTEATTGTPKLHQGLPVGSGPVPDSCKR